jgi:hypothetical protein
VKIADFGIAKLVGTHSETSPSRRTVPAWVRLTTWLRNRSKIRPGWIIGPMSIRSAWSSTNC